MIFTLLYRNMTRHRLRLFLTLMAIAMSVGLSFTVFSMLAGLEKDLLEGALKSTGHVTVATREYMQKSRFEPLAYAMEWNDSLGRRLKTIPGVDKVCPRIRFGLLLDNGIDNEAFPAVGLDMILEHSDLVSFLVAGELPKNEKQEILLGRETAETMHLKPGDQVTLVGKTAFNSMTAEEATLSGILDFGGPQLNKLVVMPLARAQSFLDLEGRVSMAQIYCQNFLMAPEVAQKIASGGFLPPACGVESWKEHSLVAGIYTVFHGMKRIMTGIIMLAAGMGILNIMLLTLLERRKEIGVLRALGCSRRFVFASLSSEVLLQGFLGGVAGLLWSLPLVHWLSTHGLNLTAESTKALPIAVKSVIHAQGSFAYAALSFGLGVTLSFAASLWPILKAGRIEPVEAMR